MRKVLILGAAVLFTIAGLILTVLAVIHKQPDGFVTTGLQAEMRKLKALIIIALLGIGGAAIGLTAAVWLNTRVSLNPYHYPAYSDPAHYAVVGLLAGIGVAIGLLVPGSGRS